MGELTTEALELFLKNCKIKLSGKEGERILRFDIIENLLNNNPLAIKLITSNLPENKDVIDLKNELEGDFEIFIKTNKGIAQVFDKAADINIERTRSLFHSINYSYQKLNPRTKLAFELLHLFPDGITHKNFKECFAKNKSSIDISDYEIKTLEDKSLIENNGGQIKLQSIIGRFAKYQFNQRTDNEKEKYYNDAYNFNAFILKLIETIKSKTNLRSSYAIFDKYSNNLISVITFIDHIPIQTSLGKNPFIYYINNLAQFILSEGNLAAFLKDLDDKDDFFNEDENTALFIKILKIYFTYLHRIFDKPFNDLKSELPISTIKNVEIKNHIIEEYLFRGFSLYNYEGYTIDFISWLNDNKIYDYSIIGVALFYLGNFNYNVNIRDFYKYERNLIEGKLLKAELIDYITNLYEKEHLERLQCTYTLSKIDRIEFDVIQKLVVTNPYSQGLKSLMFAFIEEEQTKKIELFENSIHNLEHIKYYYIEAIYFYAKYMKYISHINYLQWFNIGYELSNKFFYRFQLHRFKCLEDGTDRIYCDQDYPLPEDIDLDLYVTNFNEHWGNVK